MTAKVASARALKIVGHLLDAQLALQVARQRAKQLRVMRAAQHVHQRFFVVLIGHRERRATRFEFALVVGRREALLEHRVVGEFIDHAGVALQITRGPLGRAQQMQQPLLHHGALQQQRQITLAPQQRLDPVDQAQRADLVHAAVQQPLRRALHDAQQPRARVVAQRLHFGVVLPLRHARGHCGRQLAEQPFEQQHRRLRALRAKIAQAVQAGVRRAAEQRVEFARDALPVRIELLQKIAAVGVAQRLRDP